MIWSTGIAGGAVSRCEPVCGVTLSGALSGARTGGGACVSDGGGTGNGPGASCAAAAPHINSAPAHIRNSARNGAKYIFLGCRLSQLIAFSNLSRTRVHCGTVQIFAARSNLAEGLRNL